MMALVLGGRFKFFSGIDFLANQTYHIQILAIG
jgi:hypothetical protein